MKLNRPQSANYCKNNAVFSIAQMKAGMFILSCNKLEANIYQPYSYAMGLHKNDGHPASL
jgi:hypothetical protein